MKDFLTTRNPHHGFFRTAQLNYGLNDSKAHVRFATACTVIQLRHKATPEDACNFLDSAMGRHFADTLKDLDSNSLEKALERYLKEGLTGKDWVQLKLNEISCPEMRERFDLGGAE